MRAAVTIVPPPQGTNEATRGVKRARCEHEQVNKHTQSYIQSMPVITKVVQATFSYPTALRVFKDLPQKLPISNFIRQTASSIQSANIKGSR